MQQQTTSLSAQLGQLKLQAKAVRLEPNQAPPSLLFSQATSRTVDIDLIHSMALGGYARLRDSLCGAADVHSELLSHELKGLNRNHLTKPENEQLSTKLKKMLLWLSPFFLEGDCQKVLDYFLRNFHVHVFEGQSICLMYLQYYRSPMFVKLIHNVNLETRHLSWLKVFLRKDQSVNQDLVVKALSLDNYLLEQVRRNCLELVRDQSRHEQENTVIRLEEDPQQPINPLSFIYTVYLGLLARASAKYIPTISQFCLEVLRFDHEEAVNMAIMLFVQMMLKNDLGSNLILAVVRVLLVKMDRMTEKPTTISNIGEFVLMVWQRFSEWFDRPLVEAVLSTPIRSKLLIDRQQSLASILISLVKAYLEGATDLLEVIRQLTLRVKVDRQLLASPTLEEKFYNELFSLYEAHSAARKPPSEKKPKRKESKSQHELSVEEFQSLLKEDFLFEFAQYINRTLSRRTVKDIQAFFIGKKLKISEDGVDMKGLKRKMPDGQPEPNSKLREGRVVLRQPEMEEQEEEDELETKPKHRPLLEILRERLPNLEQVAYNEQTRPIMAELLTEYYSQPTPSITAEQKNTIVQHLGLENYTVENLKFDLGRKDWTLPILFMETCTQADILLVSASPLTSHPQLLDDLLFRQLLRKSIAKLCEMSPSHYNLIVGKLGKLADDLSKAIHIDGSNTMIVLDICSYIVRQLFHYNDEQSRGRLFKLILAHVGILTRLLNSDLHEANLQSVFGGVLDLYGPANLYIFYVGFAQQISKAQFKPATIDKLKRVMIALFLKRTAADLEVFVSSCVKGMGLVAQLVLDVEPANNFAKHRSSKYNRVPKNVLVKLFGLIHPKEKSKLIRNVLFVMRYLFLSKDFTQPFDQALRSMAEKEREGVVGMFSELYDTALGITSSNPKVNQQIGKLLGDITSLFPMSVLTKLLMPLLPNNHLYGLLADKLAEHPKFKLKDLEVVVNILPEQITVEYCRLARACIQRECKVEAEWIELMLTCEETRLSMSLIAEASKHQHYTLIPYLEKISQVLLGQLAAKDEYSLAIAHTLVSSLGGLLDPYIKDIVVQVLGIRSELVKQFFSALVEHIGTGSLIKLSLELFGEVQQQSKAGQALDYGNITNLCYLLMELARKGTGEELVKGLSSFLELISRHVLEDETLEVSTADHIQRLQADTFQLIVLKLNEAQLKKVINNLVSWSNKEQKLQNHLPFNYRKPVLVKICIRLLETMGELFVPFFSYFFEQLVNDLTIIHEKTYWSGRKQHKRQAELGARERQISINHTKSVLRLLQLLFTADPNEQFIDSVRFDLLIDPLSKLFECTRALETVDEYQAFIKESLSPCLVALCNCVKDDFKLKTLNFNILSRLKNENDDIRLAIFRFVDHLVESIGDRYLIILNDLVPFVAEHIYSNCQPVHFFFSQLQKTVKGVVKILQQLSGEDMRQYIQSRGA